VWSALPLIVSLSKELGDQVSSFLEKLRAIGAEAVPQPVDPWRLRLERVRGKLGFDGVVNCPGIAGGYLV